MTKQQFGQTIKQKYPQYANVPDEQLADRVVQKYPQYQSKIEQPKSIGGFLSNVASSAGNAIGGIVDTVAHPIRTAQNLGNLALGAGQLLIPGEQGKEQVARNVGNFYKQRYGGLSNIGNTLYNDPVGAALDVSALLGGAGAVAKGVGTLGKIEGLTRLGTGLAETGAAIDPLTAPFRIAGGAIRKVSPALESASENVITKGIGNPQAQAKIAQRTGESAGSFMKRYNILDRSPETAKAAKQAILNQYDELAVKSGNQANIQQLLNDINNEMTRIETSPAKFSQSNQNKLAELANRRSQIIQTLGTGQADVGTLTEFRRQAIEPDIPQSMFNLDARGSGTAKGTKFTRDMIRKAINATDPRLERLGLDYGVAKDIEKILTQAQTRGANRQLINFSKLGGAGIGGIAAGAPGAVGGYVTEQILNNPLFIKTLSDLLGKGAEVTKTGTKAPNLFSKGYTGSKIFSRSQTGVPRGQ